MKTYLFAVALGPVQGFIGAARRTRDFWMGSTLLSECAKRAARWVADDGTGTPSKLERLIFPAPSSSDDLTEWAFDETNTAPTSDFNVTNVLLFHRESDDPVATVAAVRQAVIAQWESFVTRTLGPDGSPIRGELRADVLKLQEDHPEDVFEFFAAWVPFDPASDGYGVARNQVMRWLNGRKSYRDFAALPGVAAGLPKSSLDGRRETVLREPEKRRLDLRIRKAEQLDLIGLVKRLQFGNDSIRFPSVSRFAVDPWIRGAIGSSVGGELIEKLKAECDQLVTARVLRKRKTRHKDPIEDDWPKYPWWRWFPFEGTPLLINRHHELLDDAPRDADRELAERALERIADLIKDSDLGIAKPEPYFAIIAADGDRMGQTISKLTKQTNAQELHRAFSLAQSTFDDAVRQRIDGRRDSDGNDRDDQGFDPRQTLHGATVFAGADDVLAFVPLDQCLAAAWMMQSLFRRTLRDGLQAVDPRVVKQMEDDGSFPTLSVGIAIGHYLDPLEDLLRFAKQAEERAKNPTADDEAAGQTSRNGLAIAIHSRGGAPFTTRINWSGAAFQHLNEWVRLSLEESLSSKAAYDLRELAHSYGSRDGVWTDQKLLKEAISHDAARLLGRKRGDDSEVRENLRTLLLSMQRPSDLLSVANQLLVGQWLAKSQQQSGFRWSPSNEPPNEAQEVARP